MEESGPEYGMFGMVPPEIMGNITSFLNPGTLRSLSTTSRGMKRDVQGLQRVLRIPRDEEVDMETLRLLPGVERVEGVVRIRVEESKLSRLSRSLRGNLQVIQDEKGSPVEALEVLWFRGCLYPVSMCSITIRDSQGIYRRYQYERNFLRLEHYLPDCNQGDFYRALERIIRDLPVSRLQLEFERPGYGALVGDMFRNTRITELVLEKQLVVRLDPTFFPHVTTIRVLGTPRHIGIETLFMSPSPSVTTFIDVPIPILITTDTPDDYGNTPYVLPDNWDDTILPSIETQFPNLQHGNITIYISYFYHEDPRPATEAPSSILSDIQETIHTFQASHPHLTISQVFVEPTDEESS